MYRLLDSSVGLHRWSKGCPLHRRIFQAAAADFFEFLGLCTVILCTMRKLTFLGKVTIAPCGAWLLPPGPCRRESTPDIGLSFGNSLVATWQVGFSLDA